MNTWKWTSIGLGAILAVWVGWSLLPQPTTRVMTRLEAEFARPMEVGPAAATTQIRLQGVDVYHEVPEFPCDQEPQLEVELAPRLPNEIRVLIIACRLPEQGDEAFQDRDGTADAIVALNHLPGQPDGRIARIDPWVFRLRPGEYRVRYYLKSQLLDPEAEPLPVVQLLGKGRLRLLPPKGDGAKNVAVPLSDPDNVISASEVK